MLKLSGWETLKNVQSISHTGSEGKGPEFSRHKKNNICLGEDMKEEGAIFSTIYFFVWVVQKVIL